MLAHEQVSCTFLFFVIPCNHILFVIVFVGDGVFFLDMVRYIIRVKKNRSRAYSTLMVYLLSYQVSMVAIEFLIFLNRDGVFTSSVLSHSSEGNRFIADLAEVLE